MKENKENTKEISEYKIKEKVQVYDTVMKSLVKFSNNSSNGNVDGLLFGHETDDSIVISHAIPIAKLSTTEDINNIVNRNLFNFYLIIKKKNIIKIFNSKNIYKFR